MPFRINNLDALGTVPGNGRRTRLGRCRVRCRVPRWGGNSFGPQDVHNLAANRGNAVGDRPQQLVVSGVWDVPLFKDHAKWQGRREAGRIIFATRTFQSQRTITAYFKVGCLANPAAGQMGNARTGTIQGSGINL